MPQHRRSGTLALLNPPHTSLGEVPTMANYQPACSFILDHRGENDTGPQSAGVSHPAQHVQGVMEGTVAHPLPTQVPAANEAEQVVR